MTDTHYQPTPRDDQSQLSEVVDSSIRVLANDLHRLNESVRAAVENKITVELLRTSRYHSDDGCWGDQLTPMIKGVEGQNIDLDATIRILANNLHRMNESLRAAVEAGVTIELMRTSRFHSEAGSWGDQMTPILIQK